MKILKQKKISRKAPLIEIDTMYQPVGDGTGGKGPTYQKNKDGSIIMSSIKGKKNHTGETGAVAQENLWTM